MTFLPEDFVVPTLVAGPRFRIRPITVHDVVRVYDAVMTSRDLLWEQFGGVSGWPTPGHTLEECLIDVAWQQKEADLRHSFGFVVVSTDETRMLGFIYVGPPSKLGGEAVVAFWVRTGEPMPGLEKELDEFVREWTTTAWPFKQVHFPGRDIAWPEWSALPAP